MYFKLLHMHDAFIFYVVGFKIVYTEKKMFILKFSLTYDAGTCRRYVNTAFKILLVGYGFFAVFR